MKEPDPQPIDDGVRGGRLAWAAPVIDGSIELARRPRVRRGATIALLLFAVGAVGLLVLGNLDQLRSAPWRLEWGRLALGLALQTSTCVVATLLWADISSQLGAGWNPRRDARVYAYSLIARRLPGAFWHVIGRAAYYGDVGLGRRVGVLGSALEAGLLVVTGTAVWLAAFADIQPYGLVLAALLLAAWPPLVRPAARLIPRLDVAWLPPLSRLYLWTAVDVAAWLLGCGGVYFLFDALYPLPPGNWWLVVAATSGSIVASAAVVVLPGGLGLRELGLAGFMSGIMPAGVAAALAIAFRISIASIEVLYALGLVLLLPARTREEDVADAR